MGKSKKQGKSAASSDAERTRIVKVRLNDTEVADIRVAAAINDLPVAEFVRAVALEQAAKIIAARYSSK